jgi:DNA replication and repair protein RecF
MFIKHLSLANFRNYETAEVELQKGVNLLVGPNGQGKTNLVEAIRYLSTRSSHRVAA